MGNINLENELNAACRAVRQHHLDRLPTLGVSGRAIGELGQYQLPFGVARVNPLPDSLYEPSDEGSPFMLMPVIERGGVIDAIAFNTSQPARWLWRIGQGWALGLDELRPRWDDGPVPVFATPLEWLANAGQGICVLDWSAPDHEVESLRLREGLAATTPMLAARLHKLLSRPRWIPEIVKMEAQNAA